MTNEEFEELKLVGKSVAIGERSPDEFYELLAIHAGELIAAVEELNDIKERSIHQSWEGANNDKLRDCMRWLGAVNKAQNERNDKLQALAEDMAEALEAQHKDGTVMQLGVDALKAWERR